MCDRDGRLVALALKTLVQHFQVLFHQIIGGVILQIKIGAYAAVLHPH